LCKVAGQFTRILGCSRPSILIAVRIVLFLWIFLSPVDALVFQVFVYGLFDYESLKVLSLTIDQAIDMPNVAFRTIAWKL
jgi:hypothetical protein